MTSVAGALQLNHNNISISIDGKNIYAALAVFEFAELLRDNKELRVK